MANLALVLQVLNVSGIDYNELSLVRIHRAFDRKNTRRHKWHDTHQQKYEQCTSFVELNITIHLHPDITYVTVLAERWYKFVKLIFRYRP